MIKSNFICIRRIYWHLCICYFHSHQHTQTSFSIFNWDAFGCVVDAIEEFTKRDDVDGSSFFCVAIGLVSVEPSIMNYKLCDMGKYVDSCKQHRLLAGHFKWTKYIWVSRVRSGNFLENTKVSSQFVEAYENYISMIYSLKSVV